MRGWLLIKGAVQNRSIVLSLPFLQVGHAIVASNARSAPRYRLSSPHLHWHLIPRYLDDPMGTVRMGGVSP
jgi:hypothetical protein